MKTLTINKLPMKKLLATAIVGAFTLVPAAAAHADTTVVIGGVVATPAQVIATDTGTASDSLPVVSVSKADAHRAEEAAKKAAKAEEKADKKAAHDEAEAAKKADHELRVDDNAVRSPIWQDASLIDNSGRKFG